MDEMTQVAPYPAILADLVDKLAYRPGWQFHLNHIDRGQGSVGLTLDIVTRGYNSYHPKAGEVYCVHHYMIVPPASYNKRSWQHWLLQQCMLVDDHEAYEFFVVDGEHPYAPNHGPGNDPYMLVEIGTKEDADTNFRGERVND